MPTATAPADLMWGMLPSGDPAMPLSKRRAIRAAYEHLKMSEDGLRDHEPELADGDLSPREFKWRLGIRTQRDYWVEVVMVLEGTSKTKDLGLIKVAAELLLTGA